MMHRLAFFAFAVLLAGCGDSTAARIGATVADSLASHVATSRSDLLALEDSLRRNFSRRVYEEADSLSLLVARRRVELQSLEDERRIALSGLPGAVTLDSLNAYYSARWSDAAFAEIFETRAGSISFSKAHFTFAYLQSPRDIAFIRIGRERDSFTSREIIRAWLSEAVEAKQRQGYQRVHVRSGQAEYGEYTEALYKKGDGYIKTFFRYSRIQGTYDRYSLQYDFYVELGSTARAERYRAEQYNTRMGS